MAVTVSGGATVDGKAWIGYSDIDHEGEWIDSVGNAMTYSQSLE